MKINILKLIQGKVSLISFDFFYEKSDIPISDEAIIFKNSLNVKGTVTKFKNDFFMECRINTRVELECSKCMQHFDYEISEKVEIIYRNNQFKKDDVDKDIDKYYSYFEEFEIDMTDDIRQFIILNTPYYPVCKNDCAGLCHCCGANLNFEKCNCSNLEQENNLYKLILNKVEISKK